MDFNDLVGNVMGAFNGMGLNAQFFVLVVLAAVTISAHVAPFTATKKDDFLIAKKVWLWDTLKTVFAVVAGNYRQAKNYTKVSEEKMAIKEAKAKKTR